MVLFKLVPNAFVCFQKTSFWHKACSDAFPNCVSFNQTTRICLECKSGYFVQKNGKCKQCDDTNCVVCNENKCMEWETGMMLVNGKCQCCDLICWHTECSLERCLECETTSDKCAECGSGLYLDSGKCFSCGKHCSECEKKGETVECTTCEEGFTTKNGKCNCLN